MISSKVDWTALGEACARYLRDHTLQFVKSPRLDARHYDEQERMYAEWVERSGRAGVPAPNLMVACLLWLCGVAMAFTLRRRWILLAMLATVAWMARGFVVASRSPGEALADENPPTEAPLP